MRGSVTAWAASNATRMPATNASAAGYGTFSSPSAMSWTTADASVTASQSNSRNGVVFVSPQAVTRGTRGWSMSPWTRATSANAPSTRSRSALAPGTTTTQGCWSSRRRAASR